ncbi:MAG: dihydroorotate dehydrogenase electron transfer subunit [Phycisphaerae bacterium]
MAPAPSPPIRGLFRAVVADAESLCREHFRITFHMPEFPAAEPGQFVQVGCARLASAGGHSGESAAGSRDGAPLLRRPFSIAGLRRERNRVALDLIGRVVGPGTRFLSHLQPGDAIDLIGPLGRPFPPLDAFARVILVAGGVGLPPLLWLAERLHATGRAALAICGARSGDLLPLKLSAEPSPRGEPALVAPAFAACNTPLIVTTDDGSLGLRGTVVTALEGLARGGEVLRNAAVCTCGPEAMMRGVAALCAAHGMACYACLERVMACGMGTCQSCVVKVHAGAPPGFAYDLCCTQGPVFDATRIIW